MRPHENTASLPAGFSLTWMDAAGLDRSVPRRGLAVLPPAAADGLAGTPGLRVLRPLGARLTGAG